MVYQIDLSVPHRRQISPSRLHLEPREEQVVSAVKIELAEKLGKNLFNDFVEVIDERKKKELKYETTFIGVKSSKISEFVKEDNIFKITVKFVSEMIICLKDKDNKIIEGNPDVIKMVYDNWKFSKNMWSQNPNWYLIETTDK